jgi:8-oxo-dGTP diphosphatase
MTDFTGNLDLTTGDAQPVPVAAGILVREDRILICQRHHSDRYGLQWEFPGGKVGNGETSEQALRRELDEELGVQAEIGPEVYRVRHVYPDRYVEVVFFRVDSFESEPRNQVFEAIAWARPRDLGAYRFLDADREIVDRIARGEII